MKREVTCFRFLKVKVTTNKRRKVKVTTNKRRDNAVFNLFNKVENAELLINSLTLRRKQQNPLWGLATQTRPEREANLTARFDRW